MDRFSKASLPQHKIDKLSDRVADDIVKVFDSHNRDMKEHEVSVGDRRRILDDAADKANERRPYPKD